MKIFKWDWKRKIETMHKMRDLKSFVRKVQKGIEPELRELAERMEGAAVELTIERLREIIRKL